MTQRLLFLSLLLSAGVLHAEGISRGPYLQMPAPDSMTVCWQTDEPSDSVVRYGTRPDDLSKVGSNDDARLEHEVRLTGLAASTTYYYAVGGSSGSPTCKFKTAPTPGSTPPVRVWVLGDSGTGGTGKGDAEKVRDAYRNSSFFKTPDLWLMLGDNAYPNGSEEETTRAIFNTYPETLKTSPLWSTFGNHDTYTDRGAPYFKAFRFPTKGECGGLPSGTEHYYSFDYANIHFICLDSEGDRRSGSPMFEWLEADLASTSQTWIIAFWHLPPYSKGSHDSDKENALGEMRRNALPILEQHGADLVLSGHSHSYERSMFIDGHYGVSSEFDVSTMAVDQGFGRPLEKGSKGAYKKQPGAHNGTVYVVGGNSGKISGGKLNHPVMKVSENRLGSIILDIKGNRLDFKEIGTDGEAFDSFSLFKDERAAPRSTKK
jgi:hypothetical protein